MCDQVAPPLNLSAIANGSTQIEITWTPNIADQSVLLCYAPDGLFGDPAHGTAYQPGMTIPGGGIVLYAGYGGSYLNSGLSPATLYRYKAFSFNSAFTYSPGISAGASTLPENKILTLSLFLQGLYQPEGIMRKASNRTGDQYTGNIADLITVELHPATGYGAPVYIHESTALTTAGLAQIVIPAEFQEAYYITVKHRNSIETTSTSPVSFTGNNISYDFSTAASQAYGNNLKNIGGIFVIFGGDVDQDGSVDTADMTPVDNDASAFVTGYLATDVNGDGTVDTGDMTIIDNNAAGFVSSITP